MLAHNNRTPQVARFCRETHGLQDSLTSSKSHCKWIHKLIQPDVDFNSGSLKSGFFYIIGSISRFLLKSPGF